MYKTTLSIAILSTIILSGCSDSNIDYIKSSRLNADETFTIEQAFDNRKLCDDVAWVSATDDRDRVIVQYQCKLVKPIAAIKELDEKRLESATNSRANLENSIEEQQKKEALEIAELKVKIKATDEKLSNTREHFDSISNELKIEIEQFYLEKPQYKHRRKHIIRSNIKYFENKINNISLENDKITADINNLKKNGYSPEHISIQRNNEKVIENEKHLAQSKLLLSKLKKIILQKDTLSELKSLDRELEHLNSLLELAQSHFSSSRMIEKLEKLKQKEINLNREILSIKEVFKFAYTGDESFEVTEAGLVFEVENEDEIKVIYKKYSDRQLYLHIEDIYTPNAFSSIIRKRHYSNL